MPKVSVIIPNYNHASYLSQRIESVLSQSYTDFELIILDDASTDSSGEVIAGYAAKYPQLRCVFNEKNSGSPFAQWNKGAELARGKYLWFAESDDYCAPNLLESLVKLIDTKPEVGLAYSQSYLVNEKGEILNSYKDNLEFIYKSKAWYHDFTKSGHEACREWLLFHNPIPNASGALMRKSTFFEAGKANPRMYLNGDWFLYAKMLAISNLAFTSKHLNYFRVHPHTQRERARTTAGVYHEIIEINRYIREHVPHSGKNADTAIKKVSTWWEGSLFYQKWRSSNYRKNLQLYRYFKQYRQFLLLHILYTLAIEVTRSLLRVTGIIKPAKRIRNWLFPGKYFQH